MAADAVAEAVLAPTPLAVLPITADVAEAVLVPSPLAVLPLAADAAATVLPPMEVAAPKVVADDDAEPVGAPTLPIADDTEAAIVPVPDADPPMKADDGEDDAAAVALAPSPDQTILSVAPAQEEVPSQDEEDKVTDVKENEPSNDCEPDHGDMCQQLEDKAGSVHSVSDTQQPTDASDEDVQKIRTQQPLSCPSYQQKNPMLGCDQNDESQDVSRAESVKKFIPREMRWMYRSRFIPRRMMMRNQYVEDYMGANFCSNRYIDVLHSDSLLRVSNDHCGSGNESDHIHDGDTCPLDHQFDHYGADHPSFHGRGRRIECQCRHWGGQRYYRNCHQGPPGFSPCNPMDIDVSDLSFSDESDHIGDDDDNGDDEFASPFGTFDHYDPYLCGRAQRTGRPCHWNDQRNHGHQFQHRFKQYDHMALFREHWCPAEQDLSRFPRERDIEKKNYNVGAALANPSRWTCFLNCILQCMVHTVPLLLKLQKADHPGSCPRDSIGFCCYCSLKMHADESIKRSGSSIYPNIFVDSLSSISPDFEKGVQQDAQEFLRCLLDKLDEASGGLNSPEEPSSTGGGIATDVFGGSLKSQLHCPECNHCSDRSEPFLDLSLEVNMVETLVDALESFTKVELIEDVLCDGCKSRVNMEKHLKVEQAPEVLVIHLKRFLNSGHNISKIHDKVKCTLELDIDPFMCSVDNAPQKYDLYGVVEHLGFNARGGHYVCYIRSSQDDWYKFNDLHVVRCSEEMVLDCTSYLLFYVKQGSSPWFSSLLEKENKISDELEDKEESTSSDGQDGPTLLDEPEQMSEGCSLVGVSGGTQELSCITGSGGKNGHVDRLTEPLETKEDGSPRGSVLNTKEMKGSTQCDSTNSQGDSRGKNDNTSSPHQRISPEPSPDSSLPDDRNVGSSEAPSDFRTCIPSEKRSAVESSFDSDKEDEQRIGNNGIRKGVGVVEEARRADNKERKRRKAYEESKASRRPKIRNNRAAPRPMRPRRPWFLVKSKRKRR